MQIVAGSLNIEVAEFLHAGYLSAYPRTFEVQGLSGVPYSAAKINVIDVKKALELKPIDDYIRSGTGETEPVAAQKSTAFPPASMATDGFLLCVSFLFFAFLISLYFRRVRGISEPGWRPWVWAGLPLGLMLFAFGYALPRYEEYHANHQRAPWADMTWFSDDERRDAINAESGFSGTDRWAERAFREYQDPAAATEAIVQGLLLPALAGCRFRVTNLAALQREVAFPIATSELTEGMVYALKTYGLDGWGHPFRVICREPDRYRIDSAGADGRLESEDDLHAETPSKGVKSDWEQRVNGLYVRSLKSMQVCFLHRVADPHFRFARAREAREATEGDCFDLLPLENLLPAGELKTFPTFARLKQRLDAELSPGNAATLLFLHFERPSSHDG